LRQSGSLRGAQPLLEKIYSLSLDGRGQGEGDSPTKTGAPEAERL